MLKGKTIFNPYWAMNKNRGCLGYVGGDFTTQLYGDHKETLKESRLNKKSENTCIYHLCTSYQVTRIRQTTLLLGSTLVNPLSYLVHRLRGSVSLPNFFHSEHPQIFQMFHGKSFTTPGKLRWYLRLCFGKRWLLLTTRHGPFLVSNVKFLGVDVPKQDLWPLEFTRASNITY